MPSATHKADPFSNNENSNPLIKLSHSIEKRIRNLEKRKTKLENYRTYLEEGKTLDDDQQKAVDAYGAVQGSIEICHEFTSMVDNLIEEHNEAIKVQQKKQQEEKHQHEFDRVKQILKFQAILSKLNNESVKADFLSGSIGALKIPKEKISSLNEALNLISPILKDEQVFIGLKTEILPAAEHLIALLDGKNRPMTSGGTSYKEVRNLLNQIANCSYPKRPKKLTPRNSKNPSPVNQVDSNKSKKSNTSSNKSNSNKMKDNVAKDRSSLASENSNLNAATPKNVTSSHSVPATKSTIPSAANETTATKTMIPNSLPKGSSSQLTHHQYNNDIGCASSKKASTSLPMAQSENGPIAVVASAGLPPGISANIPTAGLETSPMKSGRVERTIHGGITTPHGAPAQAFYPPSSLPTQLPVVSRTNVDIHDLMGTGTFNFLQESQVGTATSAVHVDPAVVSFGSVKPDGLIQMHEEQQRRLGAPPAAALRSASGGGCTGVLSPENSSIRTEIFVNTTFSSSSSSSPAISTTYTAPTQPNHNSHQRLQPATTTTMSSSRTGYRQPASLQASSVQASEPSFVSPSASASCGITTMTPSLSASSGVSGGISSSTQPQVSASWASEEVDGWGTPDSPSNPVATGSWDEFCAAEGTISSSKAPSSSNPIESSEFRRGGFRSRGRGGGGNSYNHNYNSGSSRGHFRGGGRQSSNYSGGYQGGNKYNGFTRGFRGSNRGGLMNGGGNTPSGFRSGRGSNNYSSSNSRDSENDNRTSNFRSNRSHAYQSNNAMQRNAY